MLSVTFKHFMLSVVMLNVVVLSVIMLSVVAPFWPACFGRRDCSTQRETD